MNRVNQVEYGWRETLPGVYQLKQDLKPVFTKPVWTVISVIVDDALTVIDTGIPRTPRELLWPFLDSIGRKPSDIRYVINTHGHGDHVGSNAEVKRASGATLMVHELDGPLLERSGTWGDEPIEPCPADRLLREGDVIDLGRRTLEVVHLPGHSAGAIGLYERSDRFLICGDALQANGTNVQHIAFYTLPHQYASTVEKVMALEVEHLMLAHAYAPFIDSYVTGDDVQRYVDVCWEFVTTIEDKILAELHRAAQPLTARAISECIAAQYGYQGTTSMAMMTVDAHLRRMAERGAVTAGSDGDGLWQPS